MNFVILLNFIMCYILSTNAFWWKSSQEEEVKKIPYHLIRTFSYQPILLPASPFNQQFPYGRGLIQPPSIPYSVPSSTVQNYQYTSTNQPKTTASTTPTSTTKLTTKTTASTTTTITAKPTTVEKSTTIWQDVQNRYTVEAGSSPRLAVKSAPFSDRYDFSQHLPSNMNEYQQQSQITRNAKDPINLQYVTNIAPMNVQFVPCMCPVEVRISNNAEKQNEKEADDNYLETEYNNLDEKEDKSLKF